MKNITQRSGSRRHWEGVWCGFALYFFLPVFGSIMDSAPASMVQSTPYPESRTANPISPKDTFPFFRKKKTSVPDLTESSPSDLLPHSATLPEGNDCQVVFEGRDAVTGDRKKELAYEPIFSYTAPHIKPYLPGEDLLNVQGKFIRFSGGYTFLAIKYIWIARNPQTSYGRLKSNGAIRFTLADDNTVTLFNSEEYNWAYIPDKQHYEINALYMLHPKQIKSFKSQALMRMTIYWEKGYEEYPIYPITLFQNQLRCLE